MDAAKISFLLFTVFSSLRIISYLPQIRKVALDNNGATAISYSTWSLWTCANLATALYAATNLHDFYLSSVSTIYAICCVVVIFLTMRKRRRYRKSSTADQALRDADEVRGAVVERLQMTVQHAATALQKNRRPHYAFEHDLAAQVRQVLRHDLKTAIASVGTTRRKRGWPREGATDERVSGRESSPNPIRSAFELP